MGEQKEAYWIPLQDRNNHWECSNCHQVWGMMACYINYCPTCGAKIIEKAVPSWEVKKNDKH